MMVLLVRVPYGKKEQKPELREYRVNGDGPVGTLEEYKEFYPKNTKFTISDHNFKPKKPTVRKSPLRKDEIYANWKVYRRDILQDKKLKALHPGKRISESGNIYWENRLNRADVNRRLRL